MRMHDKLDKTLFPAHKSNFNPVMQIILCYKKLLPALNYQLEKTEKATKSFSSQKFYSDKQYISF